MKDRVSFSGSVPDNVATTVPFTVFSVILVVDRENVVGASFVLAMIKLTVVVRVKLLASDIRIVVAMDGFVSKSNAVASLIRTLMPEIVNAEANDWPLKA